MHSLSSKARKRWDRTDTLVFTFGSLGCFIVAWIEFGELRAGLVTFVVLIVNAVIWLLVVVRSKGVPVLV